MIRSCGKSIWWSLVHLFDNNQHDEGISPVIWLYCFGRLTMNYSMVKDIYVILVLCKIHWMFASLTNIIIKYGFTRLVNWVVSLIWWILWSFNFLINSTYSRLQCCILATRYLTIFQSWLIIYAHAHECSAHECSS